MSRAILLTSLCLAIASLVAALELAGPRSHLAFEQPQQLAARYQLRNRTPSFYARARTGGVASPVAASTQSAKR